MSIQKKAQRMNFGKVIYFKENNQKQTQCSNKRPTEKSKAKWILAFEQTLMILSIISFLLVGLCINLLQVLMVIVLNLNANRRWRTTIKKCNCHLMHAFFSPVITFSLYWSGLKLNFQFQDLSLLEIRQQPYIAIVVPNHSYELDFLVCFSLANQLGIIGAYKTMAKDELKYLPIIGWALFLSDTLFLKRNWQQDRSNLSKKFNELLDYKQCMLNVFAEGTRWTEEKHQLSIEYAKSCGLEPFKYHLVPRVRGFRSAVRHFLRECILNEQPDEPKIFKVLNVEVLLPDKPTGSDWLERRTVRADLYCEEVHLSQEICDEVINSKDESDCKKLTELLYKIYQRKDDIVDNYWKNKGQFVIEPERGGQLAVKKSRLAWYIWFVGFCCTYISFICLAYAGYWKSEIFWSIWLGLILLAVWMVNKVKRLSKVSAIKHKTDVKLERPQRH